MKTPRPLPHLSCSLLLLPCLLHGQSVPTSAGGTPSAVGQVAPAGLLSYSLSASNSIITGYNGINGASDSFNIAGNAGFVSGSERHPTSFVYSGGYLFGNNGQPSSSFQNFGVSQVLNTRKWNFVVSDVVSFLPSTPRYGLAGIPGVGDTGSVPIATGQQAGDALLTNYGQRISNTASGSASYRITSRTDFGSFASYSTQHFLSGTGGINNKQFSAGGQLTYRVSAATSVGGTYSYSHSTYPAPYNLGFTSHALLGVFDHVFSPRLSMTASAGPQWTSGSNTRLVPTRLGVTANLSVAYAAGRTNYSLGYGRGTNTGSGVLLGAITDYLNFAGQRRFTERWNGGVFAGYGHAQSLSNDPALYTTSNSFTAGLQANRGFGQHWSIFASYAMQYQSVGRLVATTNAFDGVAHVVSFGVTYTPRPIHLGRR